MESEILDQLDNEATQIAVENMMRQYRTYLLTVPEDRMPKVTAQYTLEMPNFSNIKQSAVENAAIANVDSESDRKKFLVRIGRSLRNLNELERKLIALKYLEMDPLFNQDIAVELNISLRKFYYTRNRALYKMALSMGVEKYKEDVTV